jgi:PAS domain S-box-containing protein
MNYFQTLNTGNDIPEHSDICSIVTNSSTTTQNLKGTVSDRFSSYNDIGFSFVEKYRETDFSITVERSHSLEITGYGITQQRVQAQGSSANTTAMTHHPLLDLIPGPAFIFDSEGRLVGWNDAAYNTLFGTREHEMKSFSVLEAMHHDDRPLLQNLIGQVLASDREASTEARLLHDESQSYCWVSMTAKKIMTDSMPCVIAICRDITDQKKTEQELQRYRSQLEFALKNNGIGWWSVNLRDGSAYCSSEHARIFGYDSDVPDWSYTSFLRHVVSEDRAYVEGLLLAAKAGQNDLRFECRISRIDGQERWVLVIGGFELNTEFGDSDRMSGIVMDISERKFTELELRENRKRFDMALKAARAGVWEMDMVHNNAVWSNEAEQLLGFTQQNKRASFDLWMKVIHPEDRKSVIDIITETSKQAIESNMEFRVCWPDGSIHWLMSRGQPVFNDNGTWTGYIGTIIDITERRILLDSVRQSEADYRSLFENLPNGFAYCQMIDDDENGYNFVFLNVNERFEAFTHLSDVTGKRITEIIPGIRLADGDLFTIFSRIAQNGKPEHFEYYFKTLKDWFAVSAYCSREKHVVILFDVITQRKQIEKSLRESEHKFRNITEQISEIVFITDFSGIVNYTSPSVEKITGYSPAEVTGHAFIEFIAEEDVRKVVEKVKNAIKNRLPSEIFDLKYRKKDGSYFFGEVSVRYYHEKTDKTFYGLIGVIRDITQKKKDEQARQLLEIQLRKSERLETIGKLAGSIAHEFNNLLTPILGYAELGTIDSTEQGRDPEYYLAIMHAAERAKNLISQVLTFSKSNESTPVIVNVKSIIDEALLLLRPSIPVTIAIRKHIDQCCRNILIDPTKLHQVIVNLCTNAYQAIDHTSGEITIDLREIVPGNDLMKKLPELEAKTYIQLSISDTGSGMDEATIEHIFEPFFTTKSPDKGSGLGLSVVHGIITSYYGQITVESQPGLGTTFRIYLPVIDQRTDPASPEDLPARNKGKILFVDDEQVILDMITKMLTKIGYDICAVKAPSMAIELVRENTVRFDLVITDLTMPEMNGIEMASAIHSIAPLIPIIMMTGYGKEIEQNIFTQAHGISHILKKPVRFAELAASINEAITSRRN